ncbi:MAG: glutathione S-transferase C-terminal domain-containing protein, partial [Lysobacter sp.]
TEIIDRKEPWYEQRAAVLDGRVRQKLGELSRRLGDADWLDGDFSAGDLLMVTVLLRLERFGFVDEYPNLAAYVARARARPAYQRAFEAQLAAFLQSQSAQASTPAG